MKLMTEEQRRHLIENGKTNAAHVARDGRTEDFEPVLKLFAPWLLSELDPEEPDIAFGLCDLGVGCPELGNVSLAELAALRGPGGLLIERDRHFTPRKTLQAYADEASQQGSIIA
jgi:glycine/D-amino acid oxidase-like deaminating enzyme